ARAGGGQQEEEPYLIMTDVVKDQLHRVAEQVAGDADDRGPQGGADGVEDEEAQGSVARRTDYQRREASKAVHEPETEQDRDLMAVEHSLDPLRPAMPLR